MAAHSLFLELEDKRANPDVVDSGFERRWFVVFTLPQNEKSAIRHMELRKIEAFLPTYEAIRVWKNRQRVKCILPLFPSYVFVRISHRERGRVLQVPGVLHIVGNGRHSVPVEDAQVELLRLGFKGKKMEPYTEFVVGEKVRIDTGVMQGVEGTLVRKSNQLRFVLSVNLINQYAVVEVDADALTPISVSG
ncbi:MAG TPA: UpxY family transcription antiterminator [Terracidiphilus sp.]|jgi:transcription antitermination factor NusG